MMPSSIALYVVGVLLGLASTGCGSRTGAGVYRVEFGPAQSDERGFMHRVLDKQKTITTTTTGGVSRDTTEHTHTEIDALCVPETDTRSRIEISRFVSTRSGHLDIGVAAGTTIIVEKAEHAIFSHVAYLNGHTVEPDLRAALGSVVSLQLLAIVEAEAAVTYNPTTPQAVGSSWPVNATAFARGMGDGLVVDPSNVHGTV